jgi:hypothetical protein
MATQMAATSKTCTAAAKTVAKGRASAKVSKWVDVVPDPGTFDGFYSHFKEWWCQMETYLTCNINCFSTTRKSTQPFSPE